MTITLKVKLRSRQSKIEKVDDLFAGDNQYIAWVQSPPVDGKANEEILKLLSDYFHIRKNSIKIKTGQTSILKTIELID